MGGFNGLERLSNVECYSVYDNQWRTVAPLLLAVSSAAVVGCSGKLYVIGGAVNNDCNTNKVSWNLWCRAKLPLDADHGSVLHFPH